MDNQIIREKHGSNVSQLLELEPLGICLYRKINTSAWLGHSAQVFESNIILDIPVNYRPETNSGRQQTFQKGRPGGGTLVMAHQKLTLHGRGSLASPLPLLLPGKGFIPSLIPHHRYLTNQRPKAIRSVYYELRDPKYIFSFCKLIMSSILLQCCKANALLPVRRYLIKQRLSQKD